ncbi:MAG TPA: VOC family protein [Casimicrobiaceae bacterium]|nr:VOC family protein [Casimicrobiaceae bacterium]
MSITGMNHFNILTDDVEGTVDFYRDIVGLSVGPRPDLGFPGAWLYAGGKPILHVSGGRKKADLKPGVIDHMAFSATGLAEALQRLDHRGIHYAHRRQAGAGTWQVFFFDPNGARVELDFDPSEPDPEKHRQGDASVLPS